MDVTIAKAPSRPIRPSGKVASDVTTTTSRSKRGERSGGIRCPLCHWRPTPSNLWWCEGPDPADPAFTGCGTVWNTFATRGRCPGCDHRWVWTVCLACEAWSPHDDWYEAES